MDDLKDKGWICPKCGRSNAPWVRYCDCSDSWHVPYIPIYPVPMPTYPTYPNYYTITCGDSSCSLDSSNGTLGDK